MSRGSRLRVGIVALVAVLGAAAPGAAQAAPKRAALPYGTGTYSARLYQLAPKRYTGRISLSVTKGTVSLLSTAFYVSCQGLGLVHDTDPVPAFTVPVGAGGGFSYSGTVDGRRLRFSGILHGQTVVGAFFETFVLGTHACSTVRSATFTGAR